MSRRRDIGDRLGDRDARRRGRVEHRERRALAHRHRLARVASNRRRDRGIGHRHLPRARPSGRARIRPPTVRSPMVIRNDLSATAGNAARDRSPRRGHLLAARKRGRRERRASSRVHLRRLAEQHVHRHLDRRAAEVRSSHDEIAAPRWLADHGERTALARADTPRTLDVVGRDREHVALLRFVAPDLQRRHAGLVVRNRAQIERPPRPLSLTSLGQRVRQAAGADVVDRDGSGSPSPSAQQRSITSWQRRCISALSRCTDAKSSSASPRRCAMRRRGAAAEADQHRGAAEHDELRPAGSTRLLRRARRGCCRVRPRS